MSEERQRLIDSNQTDGKTSELNYISLNFPALIEFTQKKT